jgi:hypothetical protein
MADSAQKPAQRKRMTTREFVTALKLHAAGAKAMRDAKKAARIPRLPGVAMPVRAWLAPYALTISTVPARSALD